MLAEPYNQKVLIGELVQTSFGSKDTKQSTNTILERREI